MIQVFKKVHYDLSFFRTSIFQFFSLYGSLVIMAVSDTYYLLALFLAQYLVLALIKIVIWSTGRMFPRLRQPQNIILKSLLFVDFYEAWKMRYVVQEIRIPVVSIMYNIGSIFNFVYIGLFLEEAADKSLGIVNLDTTDNSQIAAFWIVMYFITANAFSNDSFVKCFQFDQGYQMGFIRRILSICYLFSFIFTQAYLLREVFYLDLIAGAVYVSVKFLAASILSVWISNTNPAALPKVSQNLAYNGDSLQKFLKYTLTLYILAGQTLDIAPFYKSFICKYDILISSFYVKILRLYQALECFAAIGLVINSSSNGIPNNSWFNASSGCIISFSAIVHVYYGVICVLNATKYPRSQKIFLDELNYPQVINIQEEEREDEVNQELLQGSLNSILSSLSVNFKNNPYLEHVEFQNRNGSTQDPEIFRQKVSDILVILWQDKRFYQSRVLHPRMPFHLMENNNSFTLFNLNSETFPFFLTSLTIADAIQPRDLAISLTGDILQDNIFQLKKVLVKHIFQINAFTVNFDPLNKDKALVLIPWMKTLKNEQYSYQMSITGYFQYISDLMVNNPKLVLFDLYQLD